MSSMNIEEELEHAIAIHGHRAPGVVLGVKMTKITYELLGSPKRGKALTGVVETKVCLPDALIAVIGTTPGNGNLIIHDLGKLALSLARYPSGEGYRIALRSEAANLDEALEKFMLRKGKLTHEERDKVVDLFLNLDESYFKIEKVRLNLPLTTKTPIARCTTCGELQPQEFMLNGTCKACTGEVYYEKMEE